MDYRDIIKNKYEKRCSVDTSYSLRSFSHDIGITAPRLSNILNGKQGLSYEYAKKIGTNLGLKATELEYFCDLIESKHA